MTVDTFTVTSNPATSWSVSLTKCLWPIGALPNRLTVSFWNARCFKLGMRQIRYPRWDNSVHVARANQRRGQNTHPKTDVFSLGILLYECLTLEIPFKAPSLYKMMMKIISGDAQIPDVGFDGTPSQRLSKICLQPLSIPTLNYGQQRSISPIESMVISMVLKKAKGTRAPLPA